MATSITVTLPYVLAALATGNQPVSKIDDDLNAIVTAVSGVALAAGDVTAGSGISVTTASAKPTIAATIGRSYLAGLTLSNDGSSPNTVLDIAAGQAMDSTNVILMVLSSAYTKSTSAWAVGTGNGGMASGSAVANNTWYHVFLIRRTDTGVVDIAFDTSVTGANIAANTNANYTQARRIGSFRTASGSTNIGTFVQDGDWFWLTDPTTRGLDVNANNPGTSAVTRTLGTPTGVNVIALVNIEVQSGVNRSVAYLSDLATTDVAAADGATPLGQGGSFISNGNGVTAAMVRTNTSAQIRSRISVSDVGVTLYIQTIGWIDRRGRDT